MDYIQKDLDLIRKAAEATEGEAEGKRVRRKKIAIAKNPRSTKDASRSSKGGETRKTGTRPKTLSPKNIAKPAKRNNQKETRNVRSAGRSRGKIRLPAMKRRAPSPPEKPAAKVVRRVTKATSSRKKVEAVNLPTAPLPPAVATKSRKSLDPNAVPIEAIHFELGAKIEAVDNDQWYKAKIVEVDNEKMDILVHFDGWGAKFDTWFPMTSTLIRGRTQLDAIKNAPTYEPGEDVLARWTDGNFYPATVLSVNKSGSCQVMYFDGMKKLIRPNFVKKMSEKEKEEAMQAAQKLLFLPPADLGSPLPSVSTASPSSDGRKYKTSANDRERRSAVRSGLAVTEQSPNAASAPPKRATKRRAAQMSANDPSNSRAPTVAAGKSFTGDENLRIKRPRYDNEAASATPKASAAETATPISASGPKAEGQLSARGQKIGTKRGRPPGRPRQTPLIKEKGTQPPIIKDGGTSSESETPESATKEPVAATIQKSSNRRAVSTEIVPQQTQASLRPEVVKSAPPEKKPGMPGVDGQQSDSSTHKVSSKSDQNSSSDNTSAESTSAKSCSFKPGDIVLAKWADCRSYLAYIIKKEPDDSYKIRYYDGMVKVVKSAFIHEWMGPLPEQLKSYKPKPAGAQNRGSIESMGSGRSRGRPHARSPEIKVTTRPSITHVQRSRTAPAQVQRRRTAPAGSKIEVSPPARGRRHTESYETPISEDTDFKKGERVIAKWTDLRWYPATVVCKQDNDHYKVRYTDDLIKTVKDTWLSSWSPPIGKGINKTKGGGAKRDASNKTVNKSAEALQQEKPTKASNDQQVEESKAVLAKEASEMRNERESSPVLSTTHAQVAANAFGKKWKSYFPGSTVLAKYTDGRSYPATVKELLKDGNYVVEYDNGIQITAKSSTLKPWSATALPPLSMFHRTKVFTTPQAVAPHLKSLVPAQIKTPDAKEKPVRHLSAKSAQVPRQVVRGYDAYYARFPAQAMPEENHHKFKCRVPGCTKSFRKEEILRQHHKNFHQQRYKLRDQDSQPAAPKRKSSKEEGTRRRVSADYETAAKVQLATSVKVSTDSPKEIPPSRGAKPPIDVYHQQQQQQQQGKAIVASTSSDLNSSSGTNETVTKDVKASAEVPKAKTPVTRKQVSEQEADKIVPVRRSKRTRTGSTEWRERTGSSDVKDETAKEQPAVAEKSPEPVEEEDTPEALNEDIIRCSCNVEEEEGFMIQCESCFTWQHAACIGVDQPNANKQSERKKSGNARDDGDQSRPVAKRHGIGEGYVCWVCKNPENVRKSKKFLYNNDFLTKGKLPPLFNLSDVRKETEGNTDMMMLSSLMDAIVKMQEAVHGIKQKIKVASAPGEHPLLKTWKEKPASDKGIATTPKEGQEATLPEGSGETSMEKGVPGSAQAAARTCQGASPKGKTRGNGRKGGRQSPTVLGEDHEAQVRDCRENLLDHVLELEAVLDGRVTRLMEFVSGLERATGEDSAKDTEWLQQDLKAVQKLLSNCS